MGITKKALVSCRQIEEDLVVEVTGSMGDVLTLTVHLLACVASGIANSGMVFDDPEKNIRAICEASIDMLGE